MFSSDGRLHTTWHSGRHAALLRQGHTSVVARDRSTRHKGRPPRVLSGPGRRIHLDPSVRRGLRFCWLDAAVGALVPRHDVEHPAVRLHRCGRRPSPSVTRGRLRQRGPATGPREDLGVDFLERSGAGGHLVRARVLNVAHGPLAPSPAPIGAPAPPAWCRRGSRPWLTLNLCLERFKGYFHRPPTSETLSRRDHVAPAAPLTNRKRTNAASCPACSS
jgi:hypothetical protein